MRKINVFQERKKKNKTMLTITFIEDQLTPDRDFQHTRFSDSQISHYNHVCLNKLVLTLVMISYDG